jgi:hypothetical protein
MKKTLAWLVCVVCIGPLATTGASRAEVQGKAEKKQEAAKPAAKAEREASGPTKQTPFGPVKAKAEEPPPAQKLSDDTLISAEEQGEIVVFRRKTPFGDQVWKRKKSELSDEERELLARRHPGSQEPETAPGGPDKENSKSPEKQKR